MRLRLIQRIYRKHLEWEKNMSKNVSLLEVITLLTIVVCIVLKYAPHLESRNPLNPERLGDYPERSVNIKNSYPGDGQSPE